CFSPRTRDGIRSSRGLAHTRHGVHAADRSASWVPIVRPLFGQRVAILRHAPFYAVDLLASFLRFGIHMPVIDNRDLDHVCIGTATDLLELPIGLDVNRRSAGLALKHAALYQQYVGLLWEFGFAEIDLPGAGKRTLRPPQNGHEKQ